MTSPSLFPGPASDAGAIVVYIDGGARGNPGPAGFGVRVERPDGSLVGEFHEAIGVATNNVAEYRALIAALEWACAHGHRTVHVRSDSLLLVQQMLGRYKVKHPGLQPLHERARALSHDVGRVTFEHVARALNAHADRLANAAMDAAIEDVRAPGPGPLAPTPESRTPNPQPPTPDVFTPLERAVRLVVYQHFVETGAAPDVAAIARETRATDAAIAAALRVLADHRALVLAPVSGRIWMAHPFSAVPTAYPVSSNGRQYWANCAWDAAGVLSISGDGETRTRCADCGTSLTMEVKDGRMIGDGVVHYAVPPRRFWENVAFT